MILASSGALHPAQSDEAIRDASQGTARLNERLCGMARYSEDVNCLASPVTGGAVQVGRVDQLFLLALAQGMNGRDGLASFAGAALQAQGHRILRDGKPLTTDEQLTALRAQATAFEAERLPMLRALGVAR